MVMSFVFICAILLRVWVSVMVLNEEGTQGFVSTVIPAYVLILFSGVVLLC